MHSFLPFSPAPLRADVVALASVSLAALALAGKGFGAASNAGKGWKARAKERARKLVPCEACRGSGKKDCQFCEGGGMMVGFLQQRVKCVPCEGVGHLGRPCPACKGIGYFG